jgi:hypothetical protein
MLQPDKKAAPAIRLPARKARVIVRRKIEDKETLRLENTAC